MPRVSDYGSSNIGTRIVSAGNGLTCSSVDDNINRLYDSLISEAIASGSTCTATQSNDPAEPYRIDYNTTSDIQPNPDVYREIMHNIQAARQEFEDTCRRHEDALDARYQFKVDDHIFIVDGMSIREGIVIERHVRYDTRYYHVNLGTNAPPWVVREDELFSDWNTAFANVRVVYEGKITSLRKELNQLVHALLELEKESKTRESTNASA